MNDKAFLDNLINKYSQNIDYYHNASNAYNEHSCRVEYIDPFLELLGWDVSNKKGNLPQYREVIAENYSNKTDRPDYSLLVKGITKLFVEAKKPSVDILNDPAPANQTRKYGWNAGHKISILTNFEYFILYDSTVIPKADDDSRVARYKVYHYTQYNQCFDEIYNLVSRDAVYSGSFDNYCNTIFPGNNQTTQVDKYFLKQINEWRIELSNNLYQKGGEFKSLDVLNDVVQEFINQIVFLRICEDKDLPLKYSLKKAIESPNPHEKLEELFREMDRKYNSGLFSGENIIFDLKNEVIKKIIIGLYYPQSPYLFNIIEPNMLGRIYELFLTEQLFLNNEGNIELAKKKDCQNRSVVTTPVEIVRYIVDKTIGPLCLSKTPEQIKSLRIADIACGSGIFLEEVFSFLQNQCLNWYLEYDKAHLESTGVDSYKLSLKEKKEILTSCIFGIDIDIHAVEVAKFSLLIKLIEEENKPSVVGTSPILPNLNNNVFLGNSLVSNDDINHLHVPYSELIELVPFDWSSINNGEQFDAIIGNPPYVSTEDMHNLLPDIEFDVYKRKYTSAYKQFDKHFIFIEKAFSEVKDGGYVSYIVPNKFFKTNAGEKLRQLISSNQALLRIDDFGDSQLFEDRTIYSCIIILRKKPQESFIYSTPTKVSDLLVEEDNKSITLREDILNKLPWRLTTDLEFLDMLNKLDTVAVPLSKHAEIFNGIQTSAERPTPVYWFTSDMIITIQNGCYVIQKDGKEYKIEKEICRPYFKPTRNNERGLNTYSVLKSDKHIIFPYDIDGKLYSIDTMQNKYPGTYNYLLDNYDRLVPKSVSSVGIRDVPNATKDTWYQYGRTQALTSFINTPKLIVGILSRDPMYIYDEKDMLISSGGTAGYCAISKKEGSPYELEYLQAWLTNAYTEKILAIVGSDFEGGFIARGTFVLSTLPFVELDLNNARQKKIYDRIVYNTREIYDINNRLGETLSNRETSVLNNRKNELISCIDKDISSIYRLEF